MSITNRAIINQKNKDRVREGLCLIRKKTQTNRECKQTEKINNNELYCFGIISMITVRLYERSSGYLFSKGDSV